MFSSVMFSMTKLTGPEEKSRGAHGARRKTTLTLLSGPWLSHPATFPERRRSVADHGQPKAASSIDIRTTGQEEGYGCES
jgi:hypothetical protein